MMKNHCVIDYIALILIVIGGLNWGLVGLFNFNLVTAIFGDMTLLARLVYIVVGVAALYTIIYLFKSAKSCTCSAGKK